MSLSASPSHSSSAAHDPTPSSSTAVVTDEAKDGADADPSTGPAGSSDEVASVPAVPAPSKGKPATVEDAQDSDDEDAVPSKPAVDVEDAVSKAIAAAEAGEAAQPPAPHAWQAVWAPAQNAYYFYNSTTMETTWTNPLVDPNAPTPEPAATNNAGGESPPWDPSATTLPGQSDRAQPQPTASASTYPSHRQAPSASFSYGSSTNNPPQPEPSYGGIDPGLAHLLPPSYNPLAPGGSSSSARFNKRTGKFESDPNRTPDHLSDFSRAKRQSGAYFDQDAWEREREEEHERQRTEEEGGGKRKRLSKADVQRFKDKKEAKRSQRNGWLRS